MAAIRALRPTLSRALRFRPSPRPSPRLFTSATAPPLPHPASPAPSRPSSDIPPSQPPSSSPSASSSSREGLRVRLDQHASQLIDEHREALKRVLSAVHSLPDASVRDVRLLRAEIARLGDGFFMLVVAGEYNAGKSSLVNALLRRDVLPEGPTPTTQRVTKLRYAERSTPGVVEEGGVEVVGERVGVLASRLQIVDTPGTNAVDRTHERITREFLPLCDLVLFVTSADRPFSESERLFLESIREWGKKVVLVVNKIDLLETDDAKQQVMDFVSSSAQTLLGNDSKVFALSARKAKSSARKSQKEAVEQSETDFDALEKYINDALDSVERLRLKLRASASLGTNLAEKYLSVLASNKKVVDADQETIHDIENLLQRHEETVRKGYPGQIAQADNALLEVSDRADVFFDTHVRLANMGRLMNPKVLESAFDEEVIKGTAKSIQRQVQGIAEWLSDLSSKNLTETTAIISRREGERASQIASLMKPKDSGDEERESSLLFTKFASENDIAGSLGRQRLVTRLSDASEALSTEFVSRKEGAKIADKVVGSVRMSAGLGLGAIGSFGAFIAGSSAFAPAMVLGDPTMPIIATVLGTSAIANLPRQKMLLRTDLRNRVQSTRTRLRNELRSRMEEQLTAHVEGIQSALQPFADFSGEQNRELRERMEDVDDALEAVNSLEDKIASVEKVDFGNDPKES